MKYSLVFTLTLVAFSSNSFAQNTTLTENVTKAFAERAKAELLKGVSFGYVDLKDKINIPFGDITSSDDRFEIGSISKSFAGIAIAKLVVDQKLDLEAPISKYIPELAGTFCGTVTTHQLATHNARLVDDMPNEYLVDANGLIAFLKAYTPNADHPAGVRQYSNVGFVTLGLIMSRLSGQSYEDYIQKLFFTPMAMKNTGFLVNSAVFPLLVSANDVTFFPVAKNIFSDLPAAAGGIYSTVEDMESFIQLNLHPEMDSDLTAAILLSQKLGLGWDSLPGELPLWKNGAMAGYGSILKLNPTTGAGVVVLNHSLNPISVTSLADIALGGKDQFTADQSFTSSTAATMLGKYIDEREQYEIDASLSPSGFINLEVTEMASGYSTNVRLRTFDGKQFQIFDGLTVGDYATFELDSSGNHSSLHVFSFTKFDANQKPVYSEAVYYPPPVQLN